jgi:hypothetical protein
LKDNIQRIKSEGLMVKKKKLDDDDNEIYEPSKREQKQSF